MAKTKKEGVDWKGLNKKLRSEFDSFVETRFLFVYGLCFLIGGFISFLISALILIVLYITAVMSPQLTTCESLHYQQDPFTSFALASFPVGMTILGVIFLAWAWGDKYPVKKTKVTKR